MLGLIDCIRKKSSSDEEIYSNVMWHDTIPFICPITSGKVIKVYDGDTITIASYLNSSKKKSPLYRFSIRLAGIDSAEIRGKTEKEKDLAQKAKTMLSSIIMDKIVTLKNIKTEKYGRILADIYTDDGLHINQWMLDHNYAVPYDGGKKVSWG